MIPLTGGTLDHDGESLYWEVAGDDANPVVALCHGAGGNHAIWFEQVPALADRYRVLTWDHRGFGMSTDRGGRSGPAVAIGDLEALLDHIGAETAHLVGQSMGGWTALGFALRSPQRARSLVLADSLGGCPIDGWLNRAPLRPAATGAVVGRHVAVGPHLQETDPTRTFLYQQLGGMGKAFGSFIPKSVAKGLTETTYDAATLATVTCPVLCVVGSDDQIFPPEWMREAAAFFPSSRLEVIAQAGHSPYFEQPAAWNRAVGAFLDEVSR